MTLVFGLLAAEDAARAVALVQSGIRDPGRRNAALALIAVRMP